MPGSFSSFPSTSATTKQHPHGRRHHSSPVSHSPHSDSVLLQRTSAANSFKQDQRRQRPVSVPPTIGPAGVLAEVNDDDQSGGGTTTAMNFVSSEKTTTATMSAAMLGRQPTIKEDEENDDGEAAELTMETTAEEIIMLEDDGHSLRFSGKAMRDDGRREGVPEGVHPKQMKREEDDAPGTDDNQRQKEEEDELGADAAALKERQAARQRRHEPVVVGWRTLEKAMRTTADGMSPLEQFLLGSTLLSRLCSFFEMAFGEAQQRHHSRQKFNLPIKEYAVGVDGVMSAIFSSFPMPICPSSSVPGALGSPGDHSVHHQQFSSSHCMIRLQLLVCPLQFRLIAKLDYTGLHCPAESDVRIFERYFANEIVRMNNEMAVFTFVTLCRLCHPPIFASFAQLMMAQMEPQHRWPWSADLELVHIHTDGPSQQQPVGPGGQIATKIVKNSVVVPDMCKRFVFVIALKRRGQNGTNCQQPTGKRTTQQQQQKSNNGDRHLLTMRYDVDHDELTLHPPDPKMSSEEIQTIESVLKMQSELCRQQSVADASKQSQLQPRMLLRSCCIWPCIRTLLEGRHHQLQNPQQQQQVTLLLP